MRNVTEVEPFNGSRPIPEPPTKGRVRYAPSHPFPAYRYVPGSGQPHPVNDPSGHSFSNVKPPPHAEWTPHLWPVLDAWLYGVDLYNHWYFWEAHEAWEGLWQVTDKTRPPALFVQALIQCSAAMLKVHLNSMPGVTSLWQGAEGRLEHVSSTKDELMGLRPKKVLKAFRGFFAPALQGTMPSLEKGFPLLVLDV